MYLTFLGRGLLAAVLLAASVQSSAQEREALRVCADPNNMPFSNAEREGFENRIAALLGEALELPVEYTWFPQRRGFTRNTLRAIDPQTNRHKCDLIMGVPREFELGLTTRPYYRSTYAMVYKLSGPVGGIEAPIDLLELPAETRNRLRFGVHDQTPGAVWLSSYGFQRQLVGYPTLDANPNEYPGRLIERDLEQGELDAAIIWGPIAGYFVMRDQDQDLAMVTFEPQPGIRFDFAISMAVRYGEGDWRDRLETLIGEHEDEIRQILQDYNVPLLPLRESDLAEPPDDD
ncbi:MAG: quinoprotein dehydrogenase-associated putative ABC transporter substrate-binding protein [Candidatus Competibacterales bacterium]|nr:quinoprotein dehydrogenase-associated putative ABC transporter substrate-binding protein [Candidatus Competibacterales bacterium]